MRKCKRPDCNRAAWQQWTHCARHYTQGKRHKAAPAKPPAKPKPKSLANLLTLHGFYAIV
jgi:hypothetical protein